MRYFNNKYTKKIKAATNSYGFLACLTRTMKLVLNPPPRTSGTDCTSAKLCTYRKNFSEYNKRVSHPLFLVVFSPAPAQILSSNSNNSNPIMKLKTSF